MKIHKTLERICNDLSDFERGFVRLLRHWVALEDD